MKISLDHSDFVDLGETVPNTLLEVRYYSDYNFVGERIDGYEAPVLLATRAAGEALKKAAEEAGEMGYVLKLYDAYRPQRAVDHFVRWAKDENDARMRAFFYPSLTKARLIPEDYIAEHSGHSRGSTVDLTLFDKKTGHDADMGSPFDFFGEISHSDRTQGLSDRQIANRALLRRIMEKAGFRGIRSEWWHFTLRDEPYPDTYFDFPVR